MKKPLNISSLKLKDPTWKIETQKKVENILNLGIAQFEGAGKFDMPTLDPVDHVPDVNKWIGFNYVKSDPDPDEKGVHFFVDDYQFERIWNRPKTYIKLLQRYKAVMSPDFSTYGDMPLVLQMYNHYRKQWIGKLMQEYGITVIPTVRCSTDPRSYDFFLDGIPKHSVIAMSSMWASQYNAEATREYNYVKYKLEPKAIYIYGSGKHLPIKKEDNVIFIESFKMNRLNKIKANKHV